MSSQKSVENNTTPLSSVKIKVEPGTSNPPLLQKIKIEPGLSTASTAPTRLTSFRAPRDLTLGANIKIEKPNVKSEKPKKVYTPNINVQRNKKKDDVSSIKKEAKPSRGRGRGRGQGERGRGRGKTPANLIQSTGVFSEGITDTARSGSRRFSGRSEGCYDSKKAKNLIERPLLNLNQTIDKAEEEEKLKTLLRDDFIDDGSDSIPENAPLTLPLMDKIKLYKTETKAEIEKKETPVEEQVDVKPIILSNGEAVMPHSIKGKLANVVEKDMKVQNTILQIIENPTSGYMLIQFPDCLPGLRTSEEQTDPRSRRQNEQEIAKENAGKSEYCTLGSLKGGTLGKIQICKSGKTRLVIGDNAMIVDLGSQLSFRQDLVAAKIDDDNTTGELINLGKVNNTLICSPDWETMLSAL